MTLITIIICLALEILFSGIDKWRSLRWFESYVGWLTEHLESWPQWNSAIGVVLTLVFPLVIVGYFQAATADSWLGLMALLFNIVVVMYCLRLQALQLHTQTIGDSHSQEGVRAAAAELLDEVPQEHTKLLETLLNVLFVQANERVFSILLWFVLLGPIGAVLYRLTWALSQRRSDTNEQYLEAAIRLYGILGWIPARLTALGYAVAGSYQGALKRWHQLDDSGTYNIVDRNDQIMSSVGYGAAHIEPESIAAQTGNEFDSETLNNARDLVLRSLLVWAIVIAAITIVGWTT